MADDRHDSPQYTKYRSRPRMPWERDDDLSSGEPREPKPGRRRWPFRRRTREPRRRRRLTVGRVIAYLAMAVAAWLLVSLVVFLISAQIQSAKVSDEADARLSGGGFPLTTPNTILVLGSDARTRSGAEPGAQTIGQPSRSDSIMLLRIGGGANAQLSILRDTVVDIPGHGQNKINAAYALGGAALAIETVEDYLEIPINHLVEVNFENFPELINALGGITYTGNCVISKINGGLRNGGYTLRLKAGTNELTGEEALALARTRKNDCRPQENDRSRAIRQQKIINAIKDQVISFETFVRLPWVAWAAPQAIRSDMSGLTLLGLIGAELIGGESKKYLLEPSGTTTLPDGGAGLTVDEAEKQQTVEQFLQG
jgi:LCP family protein required for cell wall assembly